MNNTSQRQDGQFITTVDFLEILQIEVCDVLDMISIIETSVAKNILRSRPDVDARSGLQKVDLAQQYLQDILTAISVIIPYAEAGEKVPSRAIADKMKLRNTFRIIRSDHESDNKDNSRWLDLF